MARWRVVLLVAGWTLVVAWYGFWGLLAIVALAHGQYWLALGAGVGCLLLIAGRLLRLLGRFVNPYRL
jgi:hypothetical protein